MWPQLSPRSFQFRRTKKGKSTDSKENEDDLRHPPLQQSRSMRVLPRNKYIKRIETPPSSSISFSEEVPDLPSGLQNTTVNVEDFISVSISSTCEVEIDIYKDTEGGHKLVIFCNRPVELNLS